MKTGTLGNNLISRFAGAAMLAAASVAGISGHAQAQDMSAQPVVSSGECQLSSQEVCDLHEAANEARDYAEANPGVGVLIHVGRDFPNAHFQNADQFGQAFVNAFSQQGVEARYFLAPGDIPNTVMSFYVAHLIHGQHSGNEVKTVSEALTAIPEIALQAKTLNGIASAEDIRHELSGG